MLILLATWIAHNWWRLLIGLVAVIIIIEYHYYRKKDPDPIVSDKKNTGSTVNALAEPKTPEPEDPELDSLELEP